MERITAGISATVSEGHWTLDYLPGWAMYSNDRLKDSRTEAAKATAAYAFGDLGGRPAPFARQWRFRSDPLTRALGRPSRVQVVTERSPDATTLQALELVNGEEPYIPEASPAELIAAAESYIVAKHYDWERDEIMKRLQQAYHVLDEFKAACLTQGWEVTF